MPRRPALVTGSVVDGTASAATSSVLCGRPRHGRSTRTRAVAAAWDVSARSGAALAVILDRIAAGLRDEQDAAAEVATSLAPARATAKLLAGCRSSAWPGDVDGCPPVGFLLGSDSDWCLGRRSGARPDRRLLGRTAGRPDGSVDRAVALVLWMGAVPRPGWRPPRLPTGPVMRREVLSPRVRLVDVKSGGRSVSRRRRMTACEPCCARHRWPLSESVAAGLFGVLRGRVSGSWCSRAPWAGSSAERRPANAAHPVRDLPLAVDLLSACALAGLPLPLRARPCGAGGGRTVGAAVRHVASRWGLGADPIPGSGGSLESDPVLQRPRRGPCARTSLGCSADETLTRVAADTRRQYAARCSPPRGLLACQGRGAVGGLLPAGFHAHRRRPHDRRWVHTPRSDGRPQRPSARHPVHRSRCRRGRQRIVTGFG